MVIAFLIPLPFLLVLAYALLARGRRSIGYVGAMAGIVTLVLVLLAAQHQGQETVNWFSVSGTTFAWTALVDNLSLLLAGIVAGIGIFIFLYSAGYLEDHEDMPRFYAELSLFAAAMLGVVTSANLVQTFVCWELVGVSSYFLIGFWHDKEKAVAAARKAFITIIIGDAFFLAGILLLWHNYQTFDIPTLLSLAKANTTTVIAAACIIIGAISKSAQFPLHTWLPDAMEGPTPVSAFLHSATMVKAGLFLIARFLPLIALAGLSPMLIGIAVITLLISACMALVETDIKRVLAYSTMNQLAFILLALGLGATAAGMYHLLNHSVFKALLFLCAGVIIHMAGTQDITEIAKKQLPLTISVVTLIGVLALAGIPPLSGFFSKDAIFEATLHSGNVALIILVSIAILLSAAYIFRWYFIIFLKKSTDHASAREPLAHAASVRWEMRAPLPLLALLAVLGGSIAWAFSSWWTNGAEHYAGLGLASVLATVLSLLGVWVAYLVFRKSMSRSASSSGTLSSLIVEVFRARFLIDDLYDGLANVITDIGKVFAWIDDCINRFLDGIARFFMRLGALLRRSISGHSSSYVAMMIIGFIIILLALKVSP